MLMTINYLIIIISVISISYISHITIRGGENILGDRKTKKINLFSMI